MNAAFHIHSMTVTSGLPGEVFSAQGLAVNRLALVKQQPLELCGRTCRMNG